MAISPQVASSLFLFQVLFPFIAVALLACFYRSETVRFRLGIGAHVLLILCSSLLAVTLFGQASNGASRQIDVILTFPIFQSATVLNQTVLDQMAWRLNLFNIGMVMVVPWVSITACLLTEMQGVRSRFLILNLLLTGTFQLFLVGVDVGSCLSGIFLSALLLCFLMQEPGSPKTRTSASLFLSTQWIGGMLLATGFATLIAASSLTQSAPRQLPGSSSAVLPALGETIVQAIEKHDAASELWKDSRGLPLLLIIFGLVLMSGCFPVHVWLSRSVSTPSLAVKIWLIVWVKGVLLLGLHWLTLLDPLAIADLQHWGFFVSLLGALFMGSLLFGHFHPGVILAAAIGWSQSIACLGICAATHDFERLLAPLILCQAAGLILLAIALSVFPDRPLLARLAGEEEQIKRPGWLPPVLLISLITLTLTPTCVAAFHAWLIMISLQNWSGSEIIPAQTLLLLANLLALAGMINVVRHCLNERDSSSPVASAEDTPAEFVVFQERRTPTGERLILCYWGIVAIGLGMLFPLFLSLPVR